MKHFLTYVKHSYEVILDAESRTHVSLDHDIEAFVVHTFAKYMEQPNIPTDSIAIKMLTAVNTPGTIRKKKFEEIAEECLLIDGFKLNNRRWPNQKYFSDMGKIALEHRAYSDRPPELLYARIANQFEKMSFVLNSVRAA